MDCLVMLEDLKMTCEGLLKRLESKSASKKNKAMIAEVNWVLLKINLHILRENYVNEVQTFLRKEIERMSNEEG